MGSQQRMCLCEPGRCLWKVTQAASLLLAQAHTTTPTTPHRDHRREHRGHTGQRRASRQVQDNATPPTPLVLSPVPAHTKSRRAGEERAAVNRDIGSVQPLAPTSRRISQRDANPLPGAGLAPPHPYATSPSLGGYRSPGAAYGRHSPNAGANGMLLNGSDAYMYGQQHKVGTNSRENTTAGTGPRDPSTGARGMGVYDREQMQRVGEQDEDAGHGRGRGFWASLCCRG